MAGMQHKFTCEFGDAHGRNFAFGFLKTRVRGRWSMAEMHARPGGGPTPGAAMAAMPVIPGAHIEIDCAKMTYRLYDPLNDQPELLVQIKGVLAKASIASTTAPLKGFDELAGPLTDDGLISIIAELRRMKASSQIRMVKGDLPSEKMCDEHVGRVLNDPWNTSAHKPKYADEADAHAEELAKART